MQDQLICYIKKRESQKSLQKVFVDQKPSNPKGGSWSEDHLYLYKIESLNLDRGVLIVRQCEALHIMADST